jgi:hypothetical protein
MKYQIYFKKNLLTKWKNKKCYFFEPVEIHDTLLIEENYVIEIKLKKEKLYEFLYFISSS